MAEIIDVLIIGAGPAGLQAAVHAVRKKASVVVLGKPEKSAIYKAHVENYLCVPGTVDGAAMMEIAVAQATSFGARLFEEDVLGVEQEGKLFKVEAESKIFRARTLVISIGTSRNKLKVPGEKEFAAKGVSYCVDCDANFYRNAKVVVVGDESAAVDGALTLTNYAAEVNLVTHGLTASPAMVDKVTNSSVKLLAGRWVKEIVGDNVVQGLILDDDSRLEVDGVFVELGSKGPMELATSIGVALDMETFSYIDTDKKQQTNISGVYAAGDIAGQPYQMAKAVGEGCVAGWEAANYAKKQRRDEEKVES